MRKVHFKKDNPNQGYKCGFVIMVLALLFIAFPGWLFEHSMKTSRDLTDYRNMNTALVAQLKQEDMELQKLKLQIHEQIKAEEATKAAAKKQTALPLKDQVIAYIQKVFGNFAQQAMMVAKCESGIRAEAINDKNTNRSTDYGIFQINSIHAGRFGTDFMASWQANVDVAYMLFKEQSWGPWYSSKKCHGLGK